MQELTHGPSGNTGRPVPRQPPIRFLSPHQKRVRDKIHEENIRLLTKLQDTQSSYNILKYTQEYNETKKHRRRLLVSPDSCTDFVEQKPALSNRSSILRASQTPFKKLPPLLHRSSDSKKIK
jgi:hypothetical protein